MTRFTLTTFFDSNILTYDTIYDLMINFLSDSIFLQIVQDTEKWIKLENPTEAFETENAFREMIKVSVDSRMASILQKETRTLTPKEMETIQQDIIGSIWSEWESFNNEVPNPIKFNIDDAIAVDLPLLSIPWLNHDK